MGMKMLVIAPYQGLAELIRQQSAVMTNADITVAQGDLEESLQLLNQYKQESFDFIISRGGTAKLIKQHTSIPVIEIQVSGYDVLRTLTLLRGYQSKKIEMIGFPNVIQNFEAVSSLINIDLNFTVIDDESRVQEALIHTSRVGPR